MGIGIGWMASCPKEFEACCTRLSISHQCGLNMSQRMGMSCSGAVLEARRFINLQLELNLMLLMCY